MLDSWLVYLRISFKTLKWLKILSAQHSSFMGFETHLSVAVRPKSSIKSNPNELCSLASFRKLHHYSNSMDHNDFDLEEDIIAPLRLLLDSLVIAKLSEPDDEERKERVETGLI